MTNISLQIPICVIEPGKIPRTRSEIDLLKSSGKETMFDASDLEQIHREGLPIVIVNNGQNFFSATTHMSSLELTKSKVTIKLMYKATTY